MINKINYKLVNLAIFMFIIFLIYQTSGLWSIVLLKLFKIFFPFLIAFSVAYAFYPYSKKLQDKKIPKSISNFMVCSFVFIVFGFLILVVAPLLFEQVGSLLNGILLFIKDIQMKYDFDFGPLTNIIQDNFSKIIKDYGKSIISIVSKSFSYLSTIIITISASIYFLIDMDKIREKIKNTISVLINNLGLITIAVIIAIVLVIKPPKYGIKLAIADKKPKRIALGCPISKNAIVYSIIVIIIILVNPSK